MPNHTNETLTTIPGANWDEGLIQVDVFTGDDEHLESFPVCLEFPDNEPCLTSDVARLLAGKLIEAADLADKATLPDDENRKEPDA